jgi:hypothetical protein
VLGKLRELQKSGLTQDARQSAEATLFQLENNNKYTVREEGGRQGARTKEGGGAPSVERSQKYVMVSYN